MMRPWFSQVKRGSDLTFLSGEVQWGVGGWEGVGKEPCPSHRDQAGREEIMWGNHGPGNGLAWNLPPGEGWGDGVRGSSM